MTNTAPQIGIFYGAQAIGDALLPNEKSAAKRRRCVYRLIHEVPEDQRLPVFKLAGVICTTPQLLDEFIAKQVRAALGEAA